MAYTAVPIVATGDLWTASNHNTYIRDNFAAGVPDIFSAKGDLAAASAADTAGRLAVGTNGNILVADSAQALGMKWDGGVAAHCVVDPAQNFTTGVEALVRFDTETFDSHGCVTTGASWRFIAPVSGFYYVSAVLAFSLNSGWAGNEVAYMKLYLNGSGYRFLDRKEAMSTGDFTMTLSGGVLVSMTAAQYIYLQAFQNSGSTLSLQPSDLNHISIFKVR